MASGGRADSVGFSILLLLFSHGQKRPFDGQNWTTYEKLILGINTSTDLCTPKYGLLTFPKSPPGVSSKSGLVPLMSL